MDQSGQSVLPFLESGHYFEASISLLPILSVRTYLRFTSRFWSNPDDSADNTTENIAETFQYESATLKLQFVPNFSFGILY